MVALQAKPTVEQQQALRLVLIYLDDQVRESWEEINNAVDRLIDKHEPDGLERTRPKERHRAVSYIRGNASRDTLERNYAVFLQGLRLWLRWRRRRRRTVALPPALRSAVEIIGLETRRSAADDTFLIDRAFIESCYRQRNPDMPEAIVRRVVEEHEGFWLLYRLSTSRRDLAPAAPAEDRLVNVGLLRVLGYSYLGPADRLSPRFTFEFRGGGTRGTPRPHRAEGYLAPVEERLLLIGRRRSHAKPTLTAFSWPLSDIVLSEPAKHAERIESLAYATNSDGDQVAFYFIAKFVPGSVRYPSRTAFATALEIYRDLVGAYPYGELRRIVTQAYERACKVSLQAGGAGGKAPESAGAPVLEPDELRGLIVRSERDAVLKGR